MSNLIVLTSGRNSGKTSTLLSLKEKHPDIKGFISLSSGDKDEITLYDLDNGNKLALMSRYFKSDKKIGCYNYLEETFRYADEKVFGKDDVVVIDEIGRLELSGKGFDSLLKRLLKNNIKCVISVRTDFLHLVLDHYGVDADVYGIEDFKEKFL